jgi:spore maturation protein CgeB
MKQILVVAIALIASVSSFAQLQVIDVNKNPSTTVGKLKSGLAFIAELDYRLDDKDTIYTLSYQDNKYQHIVAIKSINFNSDGNALDGFYSICKSVFSEENKKNKDYNVIFKLGNEEMMVMNSRMMGITYVRIVIGNSYTLPLLESQVDKLFGKG